MSQKKILDKILKCLALSKSANEHEAAAALRQAKKMMEQHSINDAQLLAAGVTETFIKAGANRKPPQWESILVTIVAQAFDCASMFYERLFEPSGWKFIGVGVKPEIAQYAFSVLSRQLRKARSEFIRTNCKRLKTSSKTRRADLFCDAWVYAVYDKVQTMAENDADKETIAAYLEAQYPNLRRGLETQDRNKDRSFRQKDIEAINAGAAAGKNARLDRGVGHESQVLIGG